MTHLGYVIAAYAASALVLTGMAAWVALDLREQRRKLRRLEDRAPGPPAEPAL